MSENIVEIKQLKKVFSTTTVLDNVNLTLKKGSILGLVGENGAGKSTMMNILGGVFPCTSGEMLIEGKPYAPNSPIDAENAGIAFIHQELNVFTNLSVTENMFLDSCLGVRKKIYSKKRCQAIADAGLKKLGFDVNVSEKLENMSMDQRQMIEIAKAIMKNAKIVIFDEPTTSLSTQEKDALFNIVRDLAKNNISMIYISHTLDDIINLCDEVAVLRDGEMIGQKPIDQITKDEMIKMMVGHELKNLYPFVEKKKGKEMLRVNNLTQGNKLKDISFTLKQGEIVGLFGLMGAGRTELARAIFGTDPISSGQVFVDGKELKDIHSIKAKKAGMAFVTENRKEEGLLLPKTVKENLVMADMDEMRKRFGAVDQKKIDDESQTMVTKMKIKTDNQSTQTVNELSGGNQQKVVIGKWLMRRPKIFLLDEPTRGIDVGAKFDIYDYMNDLVQKGMAILFISSEMEELMGVCDRIMVMSHGKIVGEFDRADYSQEDLIKMAIGGMA